MTDDEPLYDLTVKHNLLPSWANTHTAAVRANTAATRANTAAIETLTKEIHTMSESQAHLDADVQALTDGLTAVEAEIANLKASPVAAALDFSKLDAAVSRLQGDAPAPAPAPADPSAPPAA